MMGVLYWFGQRNRILKREGGSFKYEGAALRITYTKNKEKKIDKFFHGGEGGGGDKKTTKS
jgi:hypothetical protein